jgi:hypothetical protein
MVSIYGIKIEFYCQGNNIMAFLRQSFDKMQQLGYLEIIDW